MSKAISQVPLAVNEPVNSYVPGSPEVKSLIDTYKKMWAEKVEIPMIINGKEVKLIKSTASVSSGSCSRFRVLLPRWYAACG